MGGKRPALIVYFDTKLKQEEGKKFEGRITNLHAENTNAIVRETAKKRR